MTGGRSPVQKKAQSLSSQNAAAGAGKQETAQGTLSQFEGPVQDSPFYKSLLSTNMDSTANAYRNAAATAKRNAAGAGFAESSPVAQGAEAETGAEEAAALARVPGETMVQATAPTLSAASTTAGIGASQQGTGLGYETGAVVPLEEQYQNSQQALWNALAKIPGDVWG